MSVYTMIVEKEDTLLNFLNNNIKNKSKNNIKALLTNGFVSINNITITKYDYKLKINDKIVIYSIQIRDNIYKNPIKVLYEDKDIIVIDKPSGLLSISTNKEKEITAYHIVMKYLKNRNKKSTIFVIHRLDKDTSGVLMFAKNEKIKYLYQDNWNNIVSNRTYIGIVEGKIKEKERTIKSYLKENNFNKIYSTNKKDGKEAITHYKLLKTNNKFSLLEINIDTGRKNQIRVHMSESGYPIIGDRKYGSRNNPIKRLGLHAYKLKMKNPINNRIIEFISPIPYEFLNLLKSSNN